MAPADATKETSSVTIPKKGIVVAVTNGSRRMTARERTDRTRPAVIQDVKATRLLRFADLHSEQIPLLLIRTSAMIG